MLSNKETSPIIRHRSAIQGGAKGEGCCPLPEFTARLCRTVTVCRACLHMCHDQSGTRSESLSTAHSKRTVTGNCTVRRGKTFGSFFKWYPRAQQPRASSVWCGFWAADSKRCSRSLGTCLTQETVTSPHFVPSELAYAVCACTQAYFQPIWRPSINLPALSPSAPSKCTVTNPLYKSLSAQNSWCFFHGQTGHR